MSAPRLQFIVQCAVLLLNVLSSPWPTSAQEPGEILICHGDVYLVSTDLQHSV